MKISKNLSSVIVLALFLSLNIQNLYAQTSKSSEQTAPKTNTAPQNKIEVTVNQTNTLLNPNNPLGIAYAEKNINNAYNLIKSNRLIEAKKVLEPVVDWLTEATEYHTNLYSALKNIDTASTQADLEKDLALKYAILRDKAAYQMALLLIEEKKYPKAVEMLVDIVRSQPRTNLGFTSYQVLQQIGFTYKIQAEDIPKEE